MVIVPIDDLGGAAGIEPAKSCVATCDAGLGYCGLDSRRGTTDLQIIRCPWSELFLIWHLCTRSYRSRAGPYFNTPRSPLIPSYIPAEDLNLPFTMDFSHHTNYAKQGPDKSVSFNTQVVIIHFTGDLCLGQSVETLSKEKDQQARNSELRKTFLTKYNEFWPSQK